MSLEVKAVDPGGERRQEAGSIISQKKTREQ